MATRSIRILQIERRRRRRKEKFFSFFSVFHLVDDYVEMNLVVDLLSLFSSTLSFPRSYLFFFFNFSSISTVDRSKRLFRIIIQSIKSSLHHYRHQDQSKLSIILNLIFRDDKKKRKIPVVSTLFLARSSHLNHFLPSISHDLLSHLFQRQQSRLFNRIYSLQIDGKFSPTSLEDQ